MPMKRLSLRKLKEVLRLHYELGLGQRQIARSCSIGPGTVYEYLQRAQAVGVSWPLPEGWEDRQLEAARPEPEPRFTRKASRRWRGHSWPPCWRSNSTSSFFPNVAA